MSEQIADVLIVGGGPAGLAAALPLGRMRRPVELFDSGEYRNAAATEMHNVSTRDGTPPAAYRAAAHAELAAYPTVTITPATVTRVTPAAPGFAVTLRSGEVRYGKRLILATGVVDELPPIPGLAALWGRVALHCPYCDGYEVRDTPLALLVSSHAGRLARLIHRLSPDLALLLNGDETTLPAEELEALAALGITIRPEPINEFAPCGDEATTIHFATGPALARRAVFVPTTLAQRAPFAAELGCERSAIGGVVVDHMQKTSVPDVWAAGDMAHPAHLPGPMQVVPVASAGGALAGAMADMDLLALFGNKASNEAGNQSENRDAA